MKAVSWGFVLSELCERGVLVQFLGETEDWGAGGWLGVRHPCLCFGRVTTVREWS